MLSFEGPPQSSLCLALPTCLDHRLIPSSNRQRVLLALSFGLFLMATISSSSSALMVLDPLLGSVHQYFLHFCPATTGTCSSGPSQNSSSMVSVTNRTHRILEHRPSGMTKIQLTNIPPIQQKQEFRWSLSIAAFLTINFWVKLKVFKLKVRVFQRLDFPTLLCLKPKPISSSLFFGEQPQSFLLAPEWGGYSHYKYVWTLTICLIETNPLNWWCS